MPSSGMALRTSWTIRCGVGGKRPSVGAVADPAQDLLAQRG